LRGKNKAAKAMGQVLYLSFPLPLVPKEIKGQVNYRYAYALAERL
jgi:hypothetical protein